MRQPSAVEPIPLKVCGLAFQLRKHVAPATRIDVGENLRNEQALLGHDVLDARGKAAMIGATFNLERLPESGTRVSCKLPASEMPAAKNHAAKN